MFAQRYGEITWLTYFTSKKRGIVLQKAIVQGCGRGPTVLVVADQRLVRAVYSQELASQPEIKQVVMARSYREAEKLAGQLLPDVIWLDVHLGRVAGVAEIGRLRKLSAASRILALDATEDE